MGHYVHMLYLITATKIIRNELGALLRVVHNTNHFYFLVSRNIHKRCSIRKAVLKNFVKLTGKHLCQSFSFNEVADLRPNACNFIKRETKCFPVSFAKFLRTPFLRNTSGRLLLRIIHRCPIEQLFRKIFENIWPNIRARNALAIELADA